MSATSARDSSWPALFTCRSTAVFSPLKLKSRSPFNSGAFRSAWVRRGAAHALAGAPRGMVGRGNRDRVIVPVLGETIDGRATGVPQSHEFVDLVVCFSGGVIA